MGTDKPLEQLELRGLANDEVLSDRVVFRSRSNGGSVVGDQAVVHRVESDKVVGHGAPVDGVVIPGSSVDDEAGRSLRRAAEGADSFGDGIGHVASCTDVLVEHLVNGNEIGTDHIPVDVLEHELEVEEGSEAIFELRNDS